ncbi:MAG: magnesium and cobalt transport protein CorA [Acidimicrobiales bacterium]
MVIVDAAIYLRGIRQPAQVDLEGPAPLAADGDAFVWIGLRMPNTEEFEAVRGRLGVRWNAAEALNPHQRPLAAVAGDQLNLVLRTARYSDALEQISFGEISLFAGPGFLVTARFGQASALDGVRAELEASPEELAAGPAAAVVAILNRVVADYQPVLAGLEQDVLEIERQVFSESRRSPARRIYYLKRQVLDLFAVIDALEDPLMLLVRGRCPVFDAASRRELAELADFAARLAQRVRTLSDLLTSALDANLTQISIQQNEDMRRISAWVAIAAVPTMLAGVYGMNFEAMPELSWRFGYPAALGLMAAACGLLYRSFRRSGWL